MEWLADKIGDRRVEFVGDSFFALASRLAPKIASTLLFMILIYREGSAVAGAFSLSIAYLTTAVMLSSIGLDELLVREVAMEPARSRQFLFNTLLIRLGLAAIGYGVLVGLVIWVFKYDAAVQRIILFMGLGIFPEGFLAVLFAVLNANKKLNWMALVSSCITVFQVVVGAIALVLGASLEILIVILLTGTSLGVLVGLIIFQRFTAHFLPSDPVPARFHWWRPDWAFSKQLLIKTIPFSLIISITSLDAQLDVILLSAFTDIASVGVYSAARMIVQLLVLIPTAIRMVIYPSLSHAYANARHEVNRIFRQSWNYLALIGIPLTLGGTILSRPILKLVYHENVPDAMVWALGILMLDLLVNFIFQPSARLMVVTDHQVLLSVLLGASMGVTILLSFILIPSLGIVGTSIARTVSSWLFFVAVEFYVARFILPNNKGSRQALKPLLASLVMVIVIWFLRAYSIFMVIPLGALIYLFIMLLIYGGSLPVSFWRKSQR